MKNEYRKLRVGQLSARVLCAYIYCSCGFGESTQDVVYPGAALIYENGSLLAENERFQIKNSMIKADIDIKRLEDQRQKVNTFHTISPDGTRDISVILIFSFFDRRIVSRKQSVPLYSLK